MILNAVNCRCLLVVLPKIKTALTLAKAVPFVYKNSFIKLKSFSF